MTDVGAAYTLPPDQQLYDLTCTTATLSLTAPPLTAAVAFTVLLRWPDLASPPRVQWWSGIRWWDGPFVQPPQPSATRGEHAWAVAIGEISDVWHTLPSDPDPALYTRVRSLLVDASNTLRDVIYGPGLYPGTDVYPSADSYPFGPVEPSATALYPAADLYPGADLYPAA